MHIYQIFLKFRKIIKMSNNNANTCCQIDAIVSIDDRGQIIIPKDVRKSLGFQSGDKFALMTCNNPDGSLCCLTLVRTDQLKGMVQKVLSPVFKEIVDG